MPCPLRTCQVILRSVFEMSLDLEICVRDVSWSWDQCLRCHLMCLWSRIYVWVSTVTASVERASSISGETISSSRYNLMGHTRGPHRPVCVKECSLEVNLIFGYDVLAWWSGFLRFLTWKSFSSFCTTTAVFLKKKVCQFDSKISGQASEENTF